MSEPKYRDEEWLREQYIEQGKSTYDIADECGCDNTTVRRWMERHDVKRRTCGPRLPDERLKDEEWLREQYVERGRSSGDIANECGCHANTVLKRIKRHGIQRRPANAEVDPRLNDEEWLHEQYVERERSTYDIAEVCGCAPGTVINRLKRCGIETRGCGYHGGGGVPPAEPRLSDEEWLRQQYVEKTRSTRDIAEVCACSHSVVYKWLNRHGIDLRDANDPRYRMGKNNHRWGGGKKPYGPGWNASKRRQVRERDGHRCQDCGTTQAEHKAEYDQKLHVHHLIKARDIDGPEERNAPENLITLCRDCHRRWEQLSEAGIRPQIDGVTAD